MGRGQWPHRTYGRKYFDVERPLEWEETSRDRTVSKTHVVAIVTVDV
jgi:hypothetical protein